MAQEKKKKAVSGINKESIEKFRKDFSDKLVVASKKMEPAVNVLTGLPPVQKILILVVILAAIAGAFYMFSYKPQTEKLVGLAKELGQVDARIQKAQKALRELKSLEDKKATMDLALREAMRALPESREIPSFLATISAAGRDAGLEFLSFKPEKEVLKDFYAEIPVSVEMAGSFHDTVMFLDLLAHMPRVVNVRNIQIRAQMAKENKELEMRTRCQIITYRFVETAAKAQGTKKGK
ncbi:type 4a pilus biogenesis protein PilO [Desulfococcaceae bacterium OttesenSCG-928-F15]|nr:type 4a pilus biogenesis protein PilO [Desulfococcaceae bacterium OttesenSCG-928-F15]